MRADIEFRFARMPYGAALTRDGVLIFNRRYGLLWEVNEESQVAERSGPIERGDVPMAWFYDDGLTNAKKARHAATIMSLLGVPHPVLPVSLGSMDRWQESKGCDRLVIWKAVSHRLLKARGKRS